MKLRFWLCALLLLVLPVGVCAAEVDSDSVSELPEHWR